MKTFLYDIKYSLSFVKLSKYDEVSSELECQKRECSKKEENIRKLKEQLNNLENYRKNQVLTFEKQVQEKDIIIDSLKERQKKLYMKIKSLSGKIGGLSCKIIRMEKELEQKNIELDQMRKELSTRPRTNLQSLRNYHENRK